MIGKSQKNKAFLLVVTLLLSLILNMVVPITAFADDSKKDPADTGENYEKLVDAFTKAEDDNKKENKEKFRERALEQLKALGIDISTIDTDGNFDQEIRAIIQLESKAAVESTSKASGTNKAVSSIEKATDSVIESQSSIKKKVEKITGNKVKKSFGYLVNGFSIDVKLTDISEITAIKGVKSVTPANVYSPTEDDGSNVEMFKNSSAGIKVSESGSNGEGIVVAIVDSGIDSTHKDLRLSQSTNEKLTQSNATAVVKNLGYGKWFTRKVPYGHNYADNNDNIVDQNPGTSMHGMHVAGIVGANGEGEPQSVGEYVVGVAPEAQLLAMKVFPNNDKMATALDDDIISAIEDSVKLGADVINMSLGSVSGTVDSNDPSQVAIKKAADAGVLTVISAGNSGVSTSAGTSTDPQNLFDTKDTSTVGAPGVAKEALTVASYESDEVIADALSPILVDGAGNEEPVKLANGTESGVAFYANTVTGVGLEVFSAPSELVSVPLGEKGIGDYTDLDVKGKIVLIQRGLATFSDKQAAAKEQGAKAAIVYDNAPGTSLISMALDDNNFLAIFVSQQDGELLIKLAEENKDKKIKFAQTKGSYHNSESGQMSKFSSWGPTPDLELKPEIAGPGGQIYSTANNNNYQTMSGTSMSSPYVAGTAALLYQSIKTKGLSLSGADLINFAKVSLMTTSQPMTDVTNGNIISPRRQGAGSVDINQAIANSTSLVDAADGDATIALKNIGQSSSFGVILTNNGKEKVTYSLNDYNGPYTETTDSSSFISSVNIDGATLKADNTEVSLEPGESKTVGITINLPASFSANQFVEGFIGFESDTAPAISIPYVGFYGNYGDGQIIDAPIYDDNTILGSGYLLDEENSYLGFDFNTINPDKIAISPNGDGRFDSAYPVLFFLRNTKTLTYEIVDNDNKTLLKLNEDKQGRKGYFNPQINNFTESYVTNATWDGTVYDTNTGDSKLVEDGQYGLKITATSYFEGSSEQSLTIPIKVDTVAPEFSNVLLTDSTISFELSDNLSDVTLDSVAIAINGNVATYDLSEQLSDNKPNTPEKVELKLDERQLPENGVNSIELLASDNAGNLGYTSELKELGESDNVVLFNIKDKDIITSNSQYYDEESQTLAVIGSYTGTDPLTVNDQAVEVDAESKTFSASLPIDDQTNAIVVKVGEEQVRNVPIEVHVTKPTLSVDTPAEESSELSTDTIRIAGQTGESTTKLTLSNSSTEDPIDATTAIQEDGSYAVDVPLENGQNLITVSATDQYENTSSVQKLVTTSAYRQSDLLVLENILTDDITIVGVGNPDYDSDSNIYQIKGRLREKVDNFTINGDPVDYDPTNLTFTYDLALKQGKQSVAFYVEGSTGDKEVIDEGYYVFVDTVLPTLQIEGLTVSDDGQYSVYTNQNPFHLTGLISDNFAGYRLYINNNNVYSDIDYGLYDEDFFAGRPAQNFDYEVPVTEGENHLTVSLADSLGNEQSKNILVNYSAAVPNAPTITADTTELTNKSVVVSATADEGDTILYSFDGENYQLYSEPLAVAVNQTVYFKSVNQFKSESEVTTYDVTNIVPKIVANPTITLSEYGEAKEPVTVTLGYSKELSETEASYTHLRYSLDEGKTFTDYTEPFTVEKTTVITAQTYDDAGNESSLIKANVIVKDESDKDESDKDDPDKDDPDKDDPNKDDPDKDDPDKDDPDKDDPDKDDPDKDDQDKDNQDKDETDKEEQKGGSTGGGSTNNTDNGSGNGGSTNKGSGKPNGNNHKASTNKGGNNGQSNTRKKSTQLLPQTGESSSTVLMYTGVGLILAGVILVIVKKRKINK